jgi:MFS family permease
MNIRKTLGRIYVRPPEPIPPEHRRLLLLVGAAMLIGGYDANIYGLAIPQIQKSLAIAEEDVGRIIFLFRLGMIPAIALSYLADRIGRRGLLMTTLAGATIATVWTAFAQNVTEFVVAQTLARVCIYTEELLCVVVVAEEFSERTRGWAVGQLGALLSLGAGVAALAFGFVNLLPFGWRAIYFLGAIPLLWLLWARRGLVETKRFQARKALAQDLRPLKSLLTNYPGRLVLLTLIAVPYAFGMASAVVLLSKFLQTTHGWGPGQVTTLILVSGLVAILGNIAAGTLSDRYGRRLVLTITALVSAVSFHLLYAWAGGAWLALFWSIGLFTYLATDTIVGALGAELFPTSHRSVASAIRLFFWLFGGGIGFLVEAELFEALGSHGQAIAWLTLAAPLCLIPIWFLPETATRSLDDISAERAP